MKFKMKFKRQKNECFIMIIMVLLLPNILSVKSDNSFNKTIYAVEGSYISANNNLFIIYTI